MKDPLKILFVEDSPDDIDLMFIEFHKKNLEIEWKRVETKKELVQELDNKWDIIISDYVLPGFSGPEAIKIIRERFELLPVIVVSGTVGEDIAVETLKLGATDYLMKGNLRRLVPSIERAVAEYKIKLENKIAEQSINEEQKRIESIFRASPIGIGVVVDRVFVEVNDKLCRMTGYAKDELINRDSEILYINSEDYKLAGKEKYKQIAEYGSGSVETSWKCKNGEIIDIILSSTPFDSKDLSKGVTFTVLDVTKSKKTLQALEESETKFRLLADHTYDWEYWINPQGKYIYISPSCEKISGYPAEKFYANPDFLFEIIHPDFREQVFNHFKEEHSQTGKASSFEFSIISAKKEQIWIEHICRPVFDKKGNFLGRRGTNRDITEQKINLEKISTLAHAVRSIGDCVSVTDVENNLIFVNNAFLKTYGYNESDIIGKKMNIFSSSKNEEIQLNILEETLKGGWQGELWNTRKDGSEFQVSLSTSVIKDENGNTLALVGVSNDITERKRAELLQEIIYNISDASNTAEGLDELIDIIKVQLNLVIDVKNFYVAFYNEEDDTFSSPYMLDEKDQFVSWAAGKTFTNYVYKLQKPVMLTKDDAIKLKETGDVEFLGALPEVWLGIPLKVKGEIYGVFAVQNYENKNAYSKNDLDVLEFVSHQMSISIERKKAESELKLAYERALESDKLKSAFLANVSHEIRTPMNGILGFSRLFSKDDLSREKQKSYIEIIQKSGIQLMSIIDDIIDIAKIDTDQFKLDINSIALNDVMLFIQSLFKEMAESKNVEFDCLMEGDVVLKSDKVRLQQVLTNLINNALKFTHEGYVKFGYHVEEKQIKFFVEDSGIGIAPENHEIIFNQFRQVEDHNTREYGGTGLGLSISKALVEKLGGEIWLESEINKGSKFYFTLPLEKENKKIEKVTKNTDVILLNKIEAILIVDDEQMNYFYLKELLDDYCGKIYYSRNGHESIDMVKKHEDISIVLMDLKMPVLGGFEATKQIKKIRPNLPIIAQTAYAQSQDKQKALESGCDDYIAKPIDEKELLHKIKAILNI